MTNNEFKVIGYVGTVEAINQVSQGTKCINFTLATNNNYTDKTTGEKVEKTEWHRFTAWNKTAELVEKFVEKGSYLGVSARVSYKEAEIKKGEETFKVKNVNLTVNGILLLGSKN